jgi:hypothetical protein
LAALCPPERFFSFANDVGPTHADIVQVALGPVGQFPARTLALPPYMERFAELGKNPRLMMICHRLIGLDGHDFLQKLLLTANICVISRLHKRHFLPLQMR